MMNAEEQEYMEYLIHNRKELTKQNTRLLNEIDVLQKKLDIAVKALKFYTMEDSYVSCFGNPVNPNPMIARQALKEIKEEK